MSTAVWATNLPFVTTFATATRASSPSCTSCSRAVQIGDDGGGGGGSK